MWIRLFDGFHTFYEYGRTLETERHLFVFVFINISTKYMEKLCRADFLSVFCILCENRKMILFSFKPKLVLSGFKISFWKRATLLLTRCSKCIFRVQLEQTLFKSLFSRDFHIQLTRIKLWKPTNSYVKIHDNLVSFFQILLVASISIFLRFGTKTLGYVCLFFNDYSWLKFAL